MRSLARFLHINSRNKINIMSTNNDIADKQEEIKEPVENVENAADNHSEDSAEQAENNQEQAAEDNVEQQLADAKKEIEQLKDNYLRKVAEFENYRKRTLKEKTELILNGGEKTITAILPVLDDFERAISDKTEDPNVIKEGMQLIFNKFVKALENIGVKKIETENKDFDVDFHEAVAMVPGVDDKNKGKVIDCLQTGYTLNDKVIRHAKVAVGQ